MCAGVSGRRAPASMHAWGAGTERERGSQLRVSVIVGSGTFFPIVILFIYLFFCSLLVPRFSLCKVFYLFICFLFFISFLLRVSSEWLRMSHCHCARL